MHRSKLHRRRFLQSLAGASTLAAVNAIGPAWSQTMQVRNPRPQIMQQPAVFKLNIGAARTPIAGGMGDVLSINGTVPGPLLEWHEGSAVEVHVSNRLAVDTSIHWHGILLPFEMDGVPGVTFRGIAPETTFTYRFPVRQSGTYWYHSHSGLQEQSGVYGPLIVHPEAEEQRQYERDYVVMLSDWTFEDPHRVMAKLKKMSDYYNYQQFTVSELYATGDMSRAEALRTKLAWDRMRMMPSDIADVTGATYSYLMNGMHPAGNWTGLFTPGERIRLRFINGSAMSYFNVRIPGLPMTVIAADGQDVQPVETDEFQIGTAETYDVIVEPVEDTAYTVMAEAMDRSGYAAGTLTSRAGQRAPIPQLRTRPLLSMVDMGMDHDSMSHDGMGDESHGSHDMPGMTGPQGSDSHAGHGMHTAKPAAAAAAQDKEDPSAAHTGHSMAAMQGDASATDHEGHVMGVTSAHGPIVARHGPDQHGAGNIGVATVQRDRLGERGTGLADVPHRVLVYRDLKRLADNFDDRPPARDLELHLTGHMERYMWSFDGVQFHEVEGPIEFDYGERLRLILVNDTMMNHPIHLHGMWMELENGHGRAIPRKHTINIMPGARVSALINADAPGRWAFHCHLLYHMDMGMFRVVRVS